MLKQYRGTFYTLTIFWNFLWFGKAHPLGDHICLCCGICLVLGEVGAICGESGNLGVSCLIHLRARGELEGDFETHAFPKAVYAFLELLARIVHEALGQPPEDVLHLGGNCLHQHIVTVQSGGEGAKQQTSIHILLYSYIPLSIESS